MRKSIYSITLMAVLSLGFTACNEKEKKEEILPTEEAVAASAVAQEFAVDISASKISWKGEKPTGTHNGTMNLSSGMVYADAGVLQSGKFTIDMNSITNLDLEDDMKKNLEAHLKGTVEGKEGDFFNVTKYPIASFELTSVDGENGNVMVTGNLTIKDKTNAIAFPATVSFPDNKLMLKSEAFKIDRTKWGVNYGSKNIFDNLGDKFIDDEIELTIELSATRSN